MAAIVAVGGVAQDRRPRLFKERIVLTSLRDLELLSRYRLDRGSIKTLIQLLGGDLTKQTKMSSAILASTQVCCHLHILVIVSVVCISIRCISDALYLY